MKIDIFNHILPAKYKAALDKELRADMKSFVNIMNFIPTLYDLDYRFQIMDKFDDLMQVLTLNMPPVEMITADPQRATDLAKLANDEMAELVAKYPDRFAGAVACLPMNNMDAALNEVDRAIKDLMFVGVQLSSPINDKPLDSPEFLPLYEKMCQYNLPIWIHPLRPPYPDYKGEKTSKYGIHMNLGWPYETSVAMTRLVHSGILEKYPELKFITHHGGAMIPFLHKRLAGSAETHDILLGYRDRENLRRPMVDYFKMFYADTAINGYTDGLMLCYAFFGAEHLLFGTDFPWDTQFGLRKTREDMEAIEQMSISDAEKKMIFEDNARRLLRLAI